MKLKLNQVKNKSQLNLNINSSRLQNPKKIISSKKNEISKKSSNENSKTLTYSNSKIDLRNSISNINKSDSSFINGNKFMNIDNIDESNYNKDLFIIPKKTNKKYYTSNIEKAVETYNEIKKEINIKLYNKKALNNTKAVQMRNFSMVTLLEKLNKVLDTIVERSRINNKKIKANSLSQSQEIIKIKNKEFTDKKMLLEKDINNNLLKSYIQQNNLLSAKYDKLTKGNYPINLKSDIANSNQEITKLEKENRELKRTQSRNELILKNLKTTKDESIYKKKLENYDKLCNEFESIIKNIKLKESESKVNEKRINKLEESKNKLIKTAKDEYHIEKPEEILEQKKKDSKDIEKMKLYIKRKELEYQILIINNTIKKLIIMENDNQKCIRELEENLSYKNLDLKLKKEEFIKLNDILEKIDIENNSYIFQTQIKIINNKDNKDKEQKNENIKIKDNKNIKEKQNHKVLNKENKEKENLNTKNNHILINDFNKNTKPKNIIQSHPEISIKELNNRYSIKKEKNPSQNNLQIAKTYNKKMILQQLDDQKKREEDNFSKIKLNKKNLKPNFSFSLNSSSKKEKQDKNVNLSVALISNRNNTKDLEEKNETEEIKEDINMNLYEDKIRPEEEEQRINTNLIQNISLNKDKKNKKEEIDNENINIEENLEENINENINEREEFAANKNIKNLNENSEEKNRQNDLNTLPFYDIEDSVKNIKVDNNNDNNNDNYKINMDNDNNKDKLNQKEENKENEIKNEEDEKIKETIENKEEKENNEQDVDNYFEDEKIKENNKNKNEECFDNYYEDEDFKENKENKENKEEDFDNYYEDEDIKSKKDNEVNKEKENIEQDKDNNLEEENYDYQYDEINLDNMDDDGN